MNGTGHNSLLTVQVSVRPVDYAQHPDSFKLSGG